MMKDKPTATEANCIICNQAVPEPKMTAGALYADGEQAFACIDHTWNRATWLLAWAHFAIDQSKAMSMGHASNQTEATYGRVFS